MDWKTILLACLIGAMPYSMAEIELGGGANPLVHASYAQVQCKTNFMVSYIGELANMSNSSGLLAYSEKLAADTQTLGSLAGSGSLEQYSQFLSSAYDPDLRAANEAIRQAKPWANSTPEEKAALAASYTRLKSAYNACMSNAQSGLLAARLHSYANSMSKYAAEKDRLSSLGLNTSGLSSLLDGANAQIIAPLQAVLMGANGSSGNSSMNGSPGNSTNSTDLGNSSLNGTSGNSTSATDANSMLNGTGNASIGGNGSGIAINCTFTNITLNGSLNVSNLSVDMPYTIGNSTQTISAVCSSDGQSISCFSSSAGIGLSQGISNISVQLLEGVGMACGISPSNQSGGLGLNQSGNSTNSTVLTLGQALRQYCLFGGCKAGINFHLDAKFDAEKLDETIAYLGAKNMSNTSLDLLARAQEHVNDAKLILAQVGMRDYSGDEKGRITSDLREASRLIKEALSDFRNVKKERERHENENEGEKPEREDRRMNLSLWRNGANATNNSSGNTTIPANITLGANAGGNTSATNITSSNSNSNSSYGRHEEGSDGEEEGRGSRQERRGGSSRGDD